MDVLLVYRSFTSAWQGVRSLLWSWCLLGVACVHHSFAYSLACFTCSAVREKSPHMFIHSQKKSLHASSIHEKISSHASSVHKKISLHASDVPPFANECPFMRFPCSSHSLSHHVLSMYLYLQSLITSLHRIHKPPHLPWCIVVHFYMKMTKREEKAMKNVQGRFQAGMRTVGTIGENCVEVTQRLRWTIWISSDCLQDLAWLGWKEYLHKFFGGSSADSIGTQ